MRQAAKLAKTETDDGSDGYASVWVITDCDDFTCLAKAQQEAKTRGVDLVVSNPCFEIWLVDHVRVCPDSCASTANCQKLAQQIGVVRATSHERKSVSRAKAVETKTISGHIEQAIGNAARHNTPEKRSAREQTPDKIELYAVWTDMEAVMRVLVEDAKRTRRSV